MVIVSDTPDVFFPLHGCVSFKKKILHFCDVKVIQAKERCTAQTKQHDKQAGRASLGMPIWRRGWRGGRECSQWLATGERG